MPKQTIKIETILAGQSAFENFASKGQFTESLAIDPDLPATSTATKASGYLVPVPTTKTSASTITDVPNWIVHNPKLAYSFVYGNAGKIYTMTSAGVVSPSGLTASTATGNGSAYYDNYIYFAKDADIARFGPLNGTRVLTQNYWTSTLSLAALTDTTYPKAIRPNIEYPNHPMHYHKADNTLYIGDVSGGEGIIHRIRTKKTTVEGDTDDGSGYNVLDLNLYGYYPTDIESNGNDIAIAAFQGNATGTSTGSKAMVFMWNGTASTWSRAIPLPDEICSALLDVNGALYAFSGNLGNEGVRVSRLVGGHTFEEVAYIQDSCPPLAGSVTHDMNRIYFGGYADKDDYGCVWALGSKIKGFNYSLFNVMRVSTSPGTGVAVSSLALSENQGFSSVKPVIGWSDGSDYGIDLPNTTYGTSYWRSQVYRVGKPFKITKIRIPLSQAVGANMTLIPTVYVDDKSSSTAYTTINNTNYSNSERHIIYKQPETYGKHDLMLELAWSGSSLLTVGLPIEIELETLEE